MSEARIARLQHRIEIMKTSFNKMLFKLEANPDHPKKERIEAKKREYVLGIAEAESDIEKLQLGVLKENVGVEINVPTTAFALTPQEIGEVEADPASGSMEEGATE